MTRKYRLYGDPEIKVLLLRREVNFPPVTEHNKHKRVSMDFLKHASTQEINIVLKERGFWKDCERPFDYTKED